MNKKIKTSLYVLTTVLMLFVLYLSARYLINKPVIDQIPVVSEWENISAPVKEQILDAVDKTKRNPTSANLGNLGMIYQASAFYQEAGKCYELAATKNTSDWIWDYYNGYLNIELGNPEKAIEYFSRVTEKNPGNEMALYYLGEAYKNIRNNDLAVSTFETILKDDRSSLTYKTILRQDHFPLEAYAKFELARIYFDSGKNDLAKQTLKELINTSPLFGASYKLLGNIYNLEGDTILGNKFTVRANDFINFSPPVDTLIDKVTLLSRSELFLLKKIDEADHGFYSDWALRLVNQGFQYFPDNNYLISKAIKIYLWKNLNDEATALIDKHIRLISDNNIELKNTGMIFFQKGLYLQAARYWEKSLELKPDETLVQEYLAKSLLATGQKQKSLDLLNNLIEMNAGNSEILADVCDILYQYGARNDAPAYLEKLKKTDPASSTLYRITGEDALVKKDYQNAIEFLEKSYKGDPENVRTIRSLGEVYKFKLMWGKYINLYRKSLKYNPNSPDFLARLGEVLISCPDTTYRNMEEGKEYSERAFTYYNSPPDILIASGSHLAYAYAMLGDKQKAVTTISQTINIGKREKIPQDQLNRLESLLSVFKNSDSN